MDDIDFYVGKYFLIINSYYLLTHDELMTYWVIEFIDNNIIYGYNSLYGSTLIFKKKDILILGDRI